MINLKVLSFSILCVSACWTGCTTMEVTKMNAQAAGSYANSAQKSGVAIGVEPMLESRRMKETFKLNLIDRGLLPILLVVENNSPDASFILAKDKVYVLSET